MVMTGGGMELTDFEPTTVSARFLVSMYTIAYLAVLSLYINLVRNTGMRRFFNIAMCGMDLEESERCAVTVGAPQQQPSAMAAAPDANEAVLQHSHVRYGL